MQRLEHISKMPPRRSPTVRRANDARQICSIPFAGCRSALTVFFNAALLVGLAFVLSGCASGKRWVNDTHTEDDDPVRLMTGPSESAYQKSEAAQDIGPTEDRLVEAEEYPDAPGDRPVLKLTGVKQIEDGPVDGKLLGVFRNTYYDFPSESDFLGSAVPIKNQQCDVIRDVPRGFFEAVCVQGSGTLATGSVVSFSKRDCGCASVCPRTGQKICFDELDRRSFPWGRGARGTPITPLRTIAVDSDVIPLGTPVYILELDGVPRKPGGPPHDGCFIAEDRGLKVQGEHVDIFTGNAKVTAHFNAEVPSNRGVHVYIGTARCQ